MAPSDFPAFDQENIKRQLRKVQAEEAEKEGLDDPNEFDRHSFEFQGKSYVTDHYMMEAERKFHEEQERRMFRLGMDLESGVSRGKGLLEQINDSPSIKTYSTLTKELLEEAMKSLAMPSDPGKELMVMTGAGGRRELEKAMRTEHVKREAAEILVKEYMTVLNEYDMSEDDKAQELGGIRRKYHEITGEHLDVADAIKSQYPYTEEESFKPHRMSTRGIELRNSGLHMDVSVLPDFLAKPDIAGKLIQAYPSFSVTEMLDEWGAKKYIAGVDPIEDASTPVVPNLGASPAGEDTGKVSFQSGVGSWVTVRSELSEGWIRERGDFRVISRGLRHLAQKLLDWGSSLTGLGVKFNLTGDQVSPPLKALL